MQREPRSRALRPSNLGKPLLLPRAVRPPSPPGPRTSPPRRGPSAQRQSRAAAAAPSSSPSSTAGASRAGRACSESAQNCSPTARRQPSTAAIARAAARAEQRAGHEGRSRCPGAPALAAVGGDPWRVDAAAEAGPDSGQRLGNLRGAVRTRGGSACRHAVAAGRAAAGAAPRRRLRARSAPRSRHRAGPAPGALRSDGGWGKRCARGVRVVSGPSARRSMAGSGRAPCDGGCARERGLAEQWLLPRHWDWEQWPEKLPGVVVVRQPAGSEQGPQYKRWSQYSGS